MKNLSNIALLSQQPTLLTLTALLLFSCGNPGAGDADTAAPTGDPLSVTSGSPVLGVQIAAGQDSSCALSAAGTVACWGSEAYGALGDGQDSQTQALHPIAVADLTGVARVASRYQDSCALRGDGTLWCWGSNQWGQLGNGTLVDSATPVQVEGLSAVSSISVGGGNVCAVRTNGTVWCWGGNTTGSLGSNDYSDSAVPLEVPGLATATQVETNGITSCALLANGSVTCWGYGFEDAEGINPYPLVGYGSIAAIALSGYDICALTRSGTVLCSGMNDAGQLGNGATSSDWTTPGPVTVSGLSNVVAIRAGYKQACAIKADGTVWCWGDNSWGQLGNGTTNQALTPTQVITIGPVLDLAVGELHTCAISAADHGVWCWGADPLGELGNGITDGINPYPTPAAVMSE